MPNQTTPNFAMGTVNIGGSPQQSGASSFQSASSPTVISNQGAIKKVPDIINRTDQLSGGQITGANKPNLGSVNIGNQNQNQQQNYTDQNQNTTASEQIGGAVQSGYQANFTPPQNAGGQTQVPFSASPYQYNEQGQVVDSTGQIANPANFSNDPASQAIKDTQMSLIGRSDQILQDTVANLGNQYTILGKLQQQQNAGSLGQVESSLFNSGAIQGQTASSQQNIQNEIQNGMYKLGLIDVEKQKLITEAKQANLNQDIQLMSKINDQIEKKRQEQLDIANNAQKKVADFAETQRENQIQQQKDNAVAQQYQSGVTDVPTILANLKAQGVIATAKDVADSLKNIIPPGLDDLVKTMRANNAPTSLIANVLKSPDISTAYKNAGTYASGGTGDIAAYNLYSNQARAAGIPENQILKLLDFLIAKKNGFSNTQNGASTDPVSNAISAIVGNESVDPQNPTGNYNAVSPIIPTGVHAGERSYGKYQVLQSNIADWTKQATGTAMTPQQFLASSSAQDAVAKDQIGKLMQKYNNNIRDVASAWFTGGPESTSTGKSDGYTNASDYINKAEQSFNNLQSSANNQGATGTTGSPAIDATSQGYTTTPVAGRLTQSAVDQQALSYLTSGTTPPMGRTGLAGIQNAAITDRMAEIDPTGNLAAHKADLKSFTSSLGVQQKYLDSTQRAFNTANKNLQALIPFMTQAGVNSASTVPLINSLNNKLKAGLTDPGTIAGYNAALAGLRAEYAQVLSRGGEVTEGQRAQATSLIPDNLTPAQIQQVADRLNIEGTNAVNEAKGQVDQITGQINQIIQPQGNIHPLVQQQIQNSSYNGVKLPSESNSNVYEGISLPN